MSSSVGKGVTADFCTCCVGGAHTGVTASLEEMDFQRSLAGAAQTGDLGRMRGWLARGAKVDGDGDSGYAPLHYAARQGHVEACLLLLQMENQATLLCITLHTMTMAKLALLQVFNFRAMPVQFCTEWRSSEQEDSSRASYKSAPGSVCGSHRGGEGFVAAWRKC